MHQHPLPFQREDHRRHFEQIVDEALHFDDITVALSASTDVNSEQLRTATLANADAIAARTPAEYRRLVEAEERAAPDRAGDASVTLAETAEGVGAFALGTSITIIVAAISAAVFLAAYYLMKLTTHHDKSIAPMRLLGFASTGIALGAAVLAGLAMVFHAGRNRGTPVLDREVREARDEWHTALLHEGVLPFMTTRLGAAAAGDARAIPARPTVSERRGGSAAERRAGPRRQ